MAEQCPPPPAVLPSLRSTDLVEHSAPVLRIYNESGPYPTTWNSFRTWGPVDSMRFDHHPADPASPGASNQPPFAVSYAVATQPASQARVDPLAVAVRECFTDGVLNRATNDPHMVVWEPTRPLQLLDLTTENDWLARAGGTLALTSGSHAVAREWSRAIYSAYPHVDGLVWNSNVLPPGLSTVLYERAQTALPKRVAVRLPLMETSLQPALAKIADDYRYTLI